MNPYNEDVRHKKILEIDWKTGGDRAKDAPFKNDYLDINSINLSLKENLYRIFNYDYFLNDLKNQTLTLIHPHKWDDPFENFLLNSEGVMDDGTPVSFEFVRDSYFAQCWSLREECDGLWRNYKGAAKFAIKVKVNARKLFDGVYNIKDQFHYLSFFIGKVDYVDDAVIADFFKNKLDFTDYQGGVEFAQTLLLKRKSFDYEQEVRVIVHRQGHTSHLLPLPLDLNTVIDEIIFDPWIAPTVYSAKTAELRAAGYVGTITRSSLYDKPFFRVRV